MKIQFSLILFFFCEIALKSYAQPIRIDLSGGFIAEPQSRHDTVMYTAFYTNNTDYFCVYPSVYLKLSYFIRPIGIQPVMHGGYNPGVSMIAAGVEKPFEISYSAFTPSLGIGYSWQDYSVGRRQFTNNDIIYWGGISVYSPLIKGIDLMLEYRLIYKKKQTMQYETSTHPADRYFLETSNFRHLLTAGISIQLMRDKKKRTSE